MGDRSKCVGGSGVFKFGEVDRLLCWGWWERDLMVISLWICIK